MPIADSLQYMRLLLALSLQVLTQGQNVLRRDSGSKGLNRGSNI